MFRRSKHNFILSGALFLVTVVLFKTRNEAVNLLMSVAASYELEPQRLEIPTAPSLQHVQRPESCKPKTYLYFLKVHKSGSSTIESILSRYSLFHNATMAFSLKDKGAPRTLLGWPIPFNKSFVRKPPSGRIHILNLHTMFHHKGIQELMPPETKYITIFRDPLQQFKSYCRYFGLQQRLNTTLDAFLKDPKKVLQKRPQFRTCYRNCQLYDAGVKLNQMDDQNVIIDKILELDKLFHLVIIDKYIEESMILLKELMCWNYDDVLVFTRNVGLHKANIASNLDNLILKWNSGDVSLYKHFLNKLKSAINTFGKDKMNRELKKLRDRKQHYFDRCIQKKDKLAGADENNLCTSFGDTFDCQMHPGAENDEWCTALFGKGMKLLEHIRKVQYGL